jgi:hypothetical protein
MCSVCGIVLVVIVVSPPGNDSIPLSYLCVVLIFSRTCLIPSMSSCIYPLWCFASSRYSLMWSCTFSATRSTLSFVIVYSSGSLCTFSFLHIPPECEIGCLCGLGSSGVYDEGVPYVPIAPAPWYFCFEAVSFFPSCTSFFHVPPFFCCTKFCVGFSLLGVALSPVGVLVFPTSTFVPLGTS